MLLQDYKKYNDFYYIGVNARRFILENYSLIEFKIQIVFTSINGF